MKRYVNLFLVMSSLFLMSQTTITYTQFKENISLNKEEAKAQLDKKYLYDGYKTTYFNYKTYEQVKEVEIYLFNISEYRLIFNGKSSPKPFRLEIYNEDKTNANRVLLFESDQMKEDNVVVQTETLNDIMKTQNKHHDRLKRVFVNYIIPADPKANNDRPTMADRGAAILVMGYEK